MFIRCLSCRGVTWVEGDCRQYNVLDCSNCSHAIQLRNVTTQDAKTRFEDAVCFAETSGIDLPSANSVLLGVMTLREALSIQGKSTPLPSDSPSTMELAANEALRSLEQQRAKRSVVKLVAIQPRIPENHSRAALFAAFGMLAASIVLGVVGWNNWSKEIESARAMESRHAAKDPGTTPADTTAVQQQDRTRPLARVRQDRDARVVQVIGRTPESVLRAFCAESGEPGRYEPLELASTKPHRIGARVGILRDYQDLSRSYAIWIQQRRTDRRWVAGSGKEPLKPFAVDSDRVGETKVELSADEPDRSS